ncbi:peptidoglycan-binding protein [Shimazuella sp. AN120528]|uniref:peptidoglycan-binding protein n=1 Tax=Shimazuella soli TaxID=1892854 RepID=UPI001F0E15B2|nr:peptidoglycan-binding protein [Shimazuella soli]MCH5586591.1 peptidoglycan-binding protein [Shimazuella soli]
MSKKFSKIPLLSIAFILIFMLTMGSAFARPDDDPVYSVKQERDVLDLNPKTKAKSFSSVWTQYGDVTDVGGSILCSEADAKSGKSDLQLIVAAADENGKSISKKALKIKCYKGYSDKNFVGFWLDGLKLKNGKKYKLKFTVVNNTKDGKTAYLYYYVSPSSARVTPSPAPSKPSKPNGTSSSSGLPAKCKSISGDKYKFPGANCFKLGQKTPYVEVLDELLIKNGAKGITKGPRFTQAEVNAVRAFQASHRELSRMADGYPGEKTWNMLVAGAKKTGTKPSGNSTQPEQKPGKKPDKKPSDTSDKCKKVVYSGKAPKFPGAECFVLGKKSPYVEKLGEMLTKAGYGKGGKGYYKVGPTPTFTDVDRRSLQRFQKDHKELAGDADGYPGPLTWKILVKEAGLSK